MEYGFNPTTRAIHVSGDIDEDSVAKAVRGIELLCSSSLDPITLYLNSGGGDVEEGYGLFDAVQTCKAHVTAVILGSCQSMAATIMLAADWRVMSMNSTLMFHGPKLGGDYPAADMAAWSTWAQNILSKDVDLLVTRSNKSAKYWRSKLKSDAVFTAVEALEHKLIDEIMDSYPYRSSK
jgi:ATP-dependent Clp protease protease subunit